MAALPKFSRGLKLVRFGVYAMLLQLVVTIIATVKIASSSSLEDVYHGLDWIRYLLAVNGLATLAMLIGAVGAIPELARLHLRVRSLVIAAVGFAVATAALVWSYQVLTGFVHALLDPQGLGEIQARMEDFKIFPKLGAAKTVGYAVGLIALLASVESSAQDNDQLALRDEAGTMRRALIVMVVGDVFYQLTYGVSGGGLAIIGLIAGLLVLGFWIWCHVKLARFLYNAAGLVNEASEIPIAIAKVEKSEPVARPSQPKPSVPKLASAPKPVVPAAPIVPTPIVPVPPVVAARPVVPTPAAAKPAAPSAPAPVVVVDPKPPAPTPAVSNTGGPDDGPKFLR